MQVSKLNESLLYKIEKYINEMSSRKGDPNERPPVIAVSKEMYELLKKNFPDDFIFE